MVRDLIGRHDIANRFYEWRRDRSTEASEGVCQGDIVLLQADVPFVAADGLPAVGDHPGAGAWLVIGNTCDFDRPANDVKWTQLVPITDLGADGELSREDLSNLREYKAFKRFYVPSWSQASASRVHAAHFLRPVTVDKAGFEGTSAPAQVEARLNRAAWFLLNACLVRFLARDDGRND
jgi:hypothetical protein